MIRFDCLVTKCALTPVPPQFPSVPPIEKAISDDPAERDKWVRRQQHLELIGDETLEPEEALAE